MRTIIIILTIAGLLYTALALYIWLFQSRFIYFPNEPSRRLDMTPRDIGLDYDDVHFEAADGVSVHGWFVPQGDGPVLLYFHGNAGNISHRLESLRFFHQLGLSVFIIDYRGYGNSSGKPDEQGTYNDALGAWHYLTRDRAIEAHRIVVFGRSLGGAVATWLAGEVSAGALIVESTLSSVPDMARIAFPFLPAGLARIRYDSAARISSVACPILLMHSRDDEVIPYEMGQKLAAAAPADTTFVTLRGGHNDAHLVSAEPYLDALSTFLARHTDLVFSSAPAVLQ